jgi:hypothetical protein
VEPVGYRGFGEYSLFVIQHLLAFPASGRPGGALAGHMRYTVKFDMAVALQLRSQNISLIAVTISGIEDVTWKIIKVWLGFTYLRTVVSDILTILYSQI